MSTELDLDTSPDGLGLTISVSTLDRGAMLHVSGEMDFDTSPKLIQAIEDLPFDGHDSVVFDMASLTFCDAAGVSAMLRSHQLISSRGGRLSIRGLSGLPRRVLRITGVDQSLNLE